MSNAFDEYTSKKLQQLEDEILKVNSLVSYSIVDGKRITALGEKIETFGKFINQLNIDGRLKIVLDRSVLYLTKLEALEEKFDKLMKLSDDYYKTDRTVIYDYANKIEALEAELENNKYKEEDEWLEGK